MRDPSIESIMAQTLLLQMDFAQDLTNHSLRVTSDTLSGFVNHCHAHSFFFFKDLLYLLEKQSYREGGRREAERESSSTCSFPSPNGCNDRGWARQKPGAFSGSPTWVQGPSIWTIISSGLICHSTSSYTYSFTKCVGLLPNYNIRTRYRLYRMTIFTTRLFKGNVCQSLVLCHITLLKL